MRESFMVGWAGQWRQQSDQFDWFSAYLKDRNLDTPWRAATVGFTILLAALPVMMIWSPAGPDRVAPVVLSIVAAVFGVIGAGLWLARWPTRRQSLLFCLMASASIAATCLAQSDPFEGLAGCHTFAVIGGFIAYFHTARHLVANLAVAMACAAILAARLADATGDVPLVVASLITITVINIGVPFGIYSLVHTLRTDLRSSDRDSLTGLLNRRPFYLSAYELLMRHRGSPDTYLVVLMLDLDNFKRLNDTQGHAAGDEALVSIGSILMETCGSAAVIGRAGGEEFVIADIDGAADPAAMAERLRQAIAALPIRITASIGTASAPLATAEADQQLIDRLVRTADIAMYSAKRAGGDQICHLAEVTPLDPV
jgi:diguanylate cyclase (GGDEF)-like protein